ncbi:FAD-dependent oxidoreductase [Paraburkholderia sp. CNPSo 3274]|uniref:FAD-dependent oxidoreductase n=1 Tax=Paraburkholderia sp. CNPSo 3274 TaxID=2940932 RepID=UPI0020B86E89|nr:FAD-dependent oxidoreductase [Paraburkholderia sp. CNPSo 3274]MCP3707731.1 FAD-dependent oxidoreductase [Paraburkholderia sp. CNPSo 3274]
MNNDIDVLIVGAGPTGSALAVDLARRGVRIRIIDRNAQGFPGSRAKGIQPRSLELLEDLGALDEVLASGSTYPRLGIHLGPFTIPKRMFKLAPTTDDIPYPNTWLIPQYSTDALIQKRLAPLGCAVEYNTQLTGLTQDAQGVSAQIEGPAGVESIRTRYVVGADGGASKVRQSLGIDFIGKTDETDRMIIIDCRIEGLNRKYWHVWPWLGGRFAGACPLPGSDLFQVMIRLQPGEEPQMDDAALDARFRQQTGSKKLRLSAIQWKTVFRPNIRLAENYRLGRVFLAGDAAHVHTPMGAQGLNTGIQDAYNLGWKLGQVLAGAPDALLDSYEDERRPIAARVLGLSTATYEALGKLDSTSIKRGEDEQQLSLTYRAGPLGSTAAGATAKLRAGDRAPDARLRDAQGNPIDLFELTRGPHFTLVAYGASAAKALAAVAWPVRGAALKRVAIDGLADADVCVSDVNGSFKTHYDIAKDTLILIRPDGYIGQIAVTGNTAEIERIAALVAPPHASRHAAAAHSTTGPVSRGNPSFAALE